MNPILLWNPDGRKKFVTMEVFYYMNNYYIPHENQNSLLICYGFTFIFISFLFPNTFPTLATKDIRFSASYITLITELGKNRFSFKEKNYISISSIYD